MYILYCPHAHACLARKISILPPTYDTISGTKIGRCGVHNILFFMSPNASKDYHGNWEVTIANWDLKL